MGLWDAIPYGVRFTIRKRVIGFRVPDVPHMDPAGFATFEASLRAARKYLEFGAGGSTVMAAGMGKAGVSIEGDRQYCSAVRRKLHGLPHGIELVYVDVGPTEEWGHLRNKEHTPENIAAWTRYVTAPFEALKGDFFDLVLVDGRFRVACALHAIAAARKRNASFRLLLDDYDNADDPRPHYRVVEDYVPLTCMSGRIAVFDVSPGTMIRTPEEDVLKASVLDSR